MKNLILLDFDDSFTFNIVSELHLLGTQCRVVHWSLWREVLTELIDARGNSGLILGPGPGHPNEYGEIFEMMAEINMHSHISVLGICLGHQLLAASMNIPVVRSLKPVHGQSVACEIPAWLDPEMAGKMIDVQRYNSLAFFGRDLPLEWLKVVNEHDEVMIMKKDQFLSYQFHPESVGTSYRKIFFRPLLKSFV